MAGKFPKLSDSLAFQAILSAMPMATSANDALTFSQQQVIAVLTRLPRPLWHISRRCYGRVWQLCNLLGGSAMGVCLRLCTPSDDPPDEPLLYSASPNPTSKKTAANTTTMETVALHWSEDHIWSGGISFFPVVSVQTTIGWATTFRLVVLRSRQANAW